MSYKKSIDRLKDIISYDKLNSGLESLPDDINISTMTICCNFNAKFNIEHITKWLKLDPDTVIVVGKRSFSQKQTTTLNKVSSITNLSKDKPNQEYNKGKKSK